MEAGHKPLVAVDVAALSVWERRLWAVVVPRRAEPFRGRWGLPGGFIRMHESLDRAAERILTTETGLGDVFLEQLYSFGAAGRDPRARVISVAYYALVDWNQLQKSKAMGQTEVMRLHVPWAGEAGGAVELRAADGARLPTAFDHAEILGMAVKRIRGKLNYAPIGFQLLQKKFTLRQLQEIHETILNRKLNKDSFRRRMLSSGLLKATGRREADVDHRPGELYGFVRRSAI
jgi:8-oxo-dGTP diphosphatase